MVILALYFENLKHYGAPTFLRALIEVTEVLMARKRNIEVRDLMRIRMVSDPQISPDGSRVAFVHIAIDYDKLGGERWLSAAWP